MQPFRLSAIELAKPSDFVEITVVWEASVRATHHFLSPKDIAYFKPLVLNNFLPAVQCYYIKDEAGKIVGFSGTLDDKLEMLFVHPSFIGCGIGKALLQHAIQKLGVCKVDVNEHNQKAVHFYTQSGFVITGRSEMDAMGKPFPILSMQLKPVI